MNVYYVSVALAILGTWLWVNITEDRTDKCSHNIADRPLIGYAAVIASTPGGGGISFQFMYAYIDMSKQDLVLYYIIIYIIILSFDLISDMMLLVCERWMILQYYLHNSQATY